MVRYLHERLGCSRFSLVMVEFSNFIEDHNLIDLPLER